MDSKFESENCGHEIIDSLYTHLRNGIFRTSLTDGILYANNALMDMHGYASLAEIQSIPHRALYVHGETYQYLMDKILKEKLIIDHRVLYKRKNGRQFWGLLTCKLLTRNGEPMLEGSIQDISELVKAEETLAETKRASEKLRLEFERFIYSASHDIRSPISSIQGLINIMKMEFQDMNAMNLVDLMSVSINRLDRFVKAIVTFAQNSKQEIKLTHIDFQEILDTVLNQLKQHLSFPKVSVFSEVDNRIPFFTDRFRLRIVLYNVLKNAFDYSDEKKSNPIIAIQIRTLPEKAVIEIVDNGIGIAPVHKEKVFSMFYRGSELSTGSGMGLYTAHDAVIRLGGTITLNSDYGIGTTIRIEFPNTDKGRLMIKKMSMKYRH